MVYNIYFLTFISGLPPQLPGSAPSYYPGADQMSAAAAASKYAAASATAHIHENGHPAHHGVHHPHPHDNFSDFVTLVCQETGQQAGGGHPGPVRSPYHPGYPSSHHSAAAAGHPVPPSHHSAASSMHMSRPLTVLRNNGKP